MNIASSILILLVSLARLSDEFNLETRAPVVKTGGQYENSFFGFSVAQHQTRDGESLLLIGAPQDKNLQPGTNHSGALYQCPVSSSTRDCVQVVTDGKRHNSGQYHGIYDGRIRDLRTPISAEIKDGQWLGVAVSSQGAGGKVIVCAHRYTVRDVDKFNYRIIDSKRAMLGMCYILESDLSLPSDTSIGASNILVVREAMQGKKLSVVHNFEDHNKYGVCQVGTAVSWIRNNRSEDTALFGAPGCFTWRGNILRQRTGSSSKYQQAVGENNFLEYTKHGHMGLSVTSGRFFNNEEQFVTGAPHVSRGESGTGEIYFYQLDPRSDNLVMDSSRTLSGGSFGAGYGFALATLDANGDDHDDLLVSAPFSDHDQGGGSVFLYLNEDSVLRQDQFIEIRGSEAESQFGLAVTSVGDINRDGFDDFAVGAPYEGSGVVYLFLGGVEGVSGYRHGQSWLRATDVASQIIRAEQFLSPGHFPLPSNLATFGSSLSGGMDLDDNDYPDLIIGAYSSNAVIMLRSRPIISVSTYLEEAGLDGVDPGKAGCDLDPDSSHACFSFRACFQVNSVEEIKTEMKIKFTIVAEPKKAVSRVWLSLEEFVGTGETKSSKVEHMIVIQGSTRHYCTSIVGYVSDSQTDLQSPVQFALSYSLVQEEPSVTYNRGQQLPSVDRFPILDQQQAKRTFFAKFQKDCGSDEVCQAQLKVMPKLFDGDRELGKSPQGAYELELGTLSDNELTLDVDVENLGEAAYEATLDIAFSSSLSYIGLGVGSEVNAPNLVNSSYLSFDLGNPFKGNSSNGVNKAKIRLRFSPASVINQTLIKFDFFANTSSVLVVDSSTYLHVVVVKRAELSILGRGEPQKVFYGGEVKGESAMRDVSEIGPLVDHRYLIKNYGPSTVDVLTVRIKWPFQVENGRPQGKWLLYLTSHPVVKNGAGSCRLPPGYFPNPLNLSFHNELDSHLTRRPKSAPENLWTPNSELLEESGANSEKYQLQAEKTEFLTRSKREVEQIVSPMLVRSDDPDDPGQLVVSLDCDRGTAKCFTITCQVYNLRANNSFSIEVKSRLWNATLVEDYSNIDRVEILSKASVIIDPVYTQDVSNDYRSIITLAYPDLKLEPLQSPSWWIYVVAAVCGIMLLVIIILILSKCGFFKRKRPEDDDFLMSANFEKVRLNGDDIM